MPAIQTKRWTRVEYERLIDLGVFGPGDRLELLGGQLVVGEPQSTDHYTAVRRVTRPWSSRSDRVGRCARRRRDRAARRSHLSDRRDGPSRLTPPPMRLRRIARGVLYFLTQRRAL
jgi:hypothetical protein